MYKMLVLIIVSFTVSCVYSHVTLLEPQEIPKKYNGQKGCYNKKFNEVLPFEEVYAPNEQHTCQAFYCQGDGYIIAMDCATYQAPSSCKVTQDLTLPYPDCCKQYDCPPSATR